jgi:hypothetical protein
MSLKLYRKFRADLLEWAKVYRGMDPEVFGSALRSTRRQMAMLRAGYYYGEAY